MSKGAALAAMLAVLAVIAVTAVVLGSGHSSGGGHSIDYELDGGVLEPGAPVSYEPGSYVELPVPHKEGMFFQGWYEDEGLTVPVGAIVPSFGKNLVLHASWGEPSTGKRATMDVSGHSLDRTVTQTGTVTYDFLSFSKGRYYIAETVSLVTSAPYITPVVNEKSDGYWAYDAHEGLVYTGSKTLVGDFFSEGIGSYACEVWESAGKTAYVYHSIYILKQESRSDDAYSERNMVSLTSVDFDTRFELDVTAWPGVDVEVPDAVSIGDSVVLTAKGESFAGWKVDGEAVSGNRSLRIDNAVPGTSYEALSSVTTTEVQDSMFSFSDHGLSLPVTVSDMSGRSRQAAGEPYDLGGPGFYKLADGGSPVKRSVYVLVDGVRNATFHVSNGGQPYPFSIELSSSEAFSYRQGPSPDDIQGRFTVDDRSVRDVASSLSSFRAGMTDREFADLVLGFVQGLGSLSQGEETMYPSETLWHGAGGPGDKSVLFATLMKALGFRAAVVEYEGSSAAAVLVESVSGDVMKKIGGDGFVMAEPGTAGLRLGQVSDASRKETDVVEVAASPKEPVPVPDSEYRIAYVLNGGSLAGDAPDGYATGVYSDLPYAVNGDRFFEGWFTDESLTVPIGAILPTQRGDLVLYASWADNLVGTGFSTSVSGKASSFLFSKTYTGAMAWSYLSYSDGAYYIQRDTDISLRSMGFFESGSIVDTDYYWSDEAGGKTYAYRGNAEVESSAFGSRSKYVCEVWESEGDVQYIYRGVYPLRMESVESGITFTYVLSKVFTFEPVTEIGLKVYAERGISVDLPPKVSIGDSFDLVASGEDFDGWYVDGVLFTTDNVLHEARATPDKEYEARTASKYVLFDGTDLYFDDYGLVSPVTVMEENGRKSTFDVGVRLKATGCFTLIDSRDPVPCVMRVFKDKTSQFSASWEHGGVGYTMSFEMRYSDLYDYASDGRDRSAFSSYDDVKGYFTMDDPYVKRVCDDLLQYKEAAGMGDREFASFVMRFVQEIPYLYDEYSRGAIEFWKYPAETFWDKGGDCEDSSILYCTLMKRMGYDTALLVFRDHAMASVHFQDDSLNYGDNVVTEDGRRYVFVETTTDGITGKDPDGYQLGDAFSSDYSPRSVRYVYVVRRRHIFRSPVTRSMLPATAGPIPAHVTVPGSIWVLPASVMVSVWRPALLASATRRMSSSSESTLRTTLACPESCHLSKVFLSFLSAYRAHSTAAWATWAASLPFPIFKSFLTTTTSLHSSVLKTEALMGGPSRTR